ncbi:tape measure protein [Desemzia sp. C1]|uniref:tape measure protein n=1 Tax=Desemzia sp. C1 TaxID=2892016 RepID=UPI001E4FA3F6|nr:tape measure protein [Desemzia sp. C1]MCI3029759.1 tape measure protein [Desemzia sp. C1]
MAHIGTTLEIYDQMSSPLQSITSSLYTAVNAFEDMQGAANSAFDGTNYDNIRSELDNVTKSFSKMRENIAQDLPPLDIPTPEPVIVPIEWDSGEVEVFKTTGIDRFKQEVSSTNTMLSNLANTQSDIASRAATMDILPYDAVNDLGMMSNRINDIRTQIQYLEQNPVDLDINLVNNQLETLRRSLQQAEVQQNELNEAMQRMDAADVNTAYKKLNTTISGTERYLRDNIESQDQFNREIRAGTNEASNLGRTLGRVVATYVSIQSIGNIINISDELARTTGRLNMINDSLQTTEQLQDLIFLAAQRSRGSYMDMAESVAQLEQRTGNLFKSNNQTIQFAENLNKAFVIANASVEETNSATLQLTQALGSGVLQGEELKAILEAAPNIIQTIADYLGVSVGSIKELASEGQITAEIVKNAMLSATDDINAYFAKMPMTFSQIWQSFKNNALMAFQPVLQKLNQLANTQAFQNFVNNGIQAVAILASVVISVFNGMIMAGQFVADNWSMIAPIVYGIATALAFYLGVLAVYRTGLAITTAIEAASAAIKTVHAAASFLQAGNTMAATAAQYGLNAALLASPITWVILGIIAIIAVLYAVVAAINHFAGTAISGTGVVAGAFAIMGAVIWNILIGIANIGIATIEFFVNAWNFGIWALQLVFIGLALIVAVVLDVILAIGISVASFFVNAWNLGVWLVQMAFLALLTLVFIILDALLNMGIATAEFFANAWNFGLWAIQMGFIGFNILALSILDGILNAGISSAEFFANAWNSGVYGIQNAFYHMAIFASKAMQAAGSGAIGLVNVVLSAISSIINTAVGGLNGLIGMANMIPGVNISAIGTVDLQVGSGVQGMVDNIGANLSAPTKAETVSLERSNLAGNYKNSVNVPSLPEAVSFDRSSLTKSFLGGIDVPKMPEAVNFDTPNITKDFLSNIELPKMPETVMFDKLDYKSIEDAHSAGYKWGENLVDNVKNFDLMDALGFDMPKTPTESDYADILDKLGSGNIPTLEEMGGLPGAEDDKGLGEAAKDKTGGAGGSAADDLADIADNTDDMKDALDMSAEDLKYLRDLAARNIVNRHTTNHDISVNLGGINNTVTKEQDLDGVVDYIVGGLEDAMRKSAEGVHD